MKDPDSAESKRCTLLREATGYVGHGGQKSFAEFIGVTPDRWHSLESGHSLSKQLAWRQAVVSADSAIPASYRAKDAIDFYLQPLGEAAKWENVVTMRSTRQARMYEPGAWVPRISPTPLLMIVASHDTVTLTDLALASYEQALEPKRLELIPGGHFDPYRQQFPVAEAPGREGHA